MKIYEAGTIVLIIVSLATLIGIGSSFFFEDDNQVEEVCEQVIEIATGNDMDLSQESIEEK